MWKELAIKKQAMTSLVCIDGQSVKAGPFISNIQVIFGRFHNLPDIVSSWILNAIRNFLNMLYDDKQGYKWYVTEIIGDHILILEKKEQ